MTRQKGAADMKPTISNAFNEFTVNPDPSNPDSSAAASAGGSAWNLRKPAPGQPNPRKSLAASLASMQADLRETDFGWSLELSPMRAVDALIALNPQSHPRAALRCLVSMEQSAWSNAGGDSPAAEIAERLSIPVIERFGPNLLVLDEPSMRQLIGLCQPTRLLVVLVEGDVDQRDAAAMNRALDAGASPLTVEIRAIAAVEILGDRSVVLHTRTKDQALEVVAQNFRHYLAALRDRAATRFAAPETWQIERLIDETGALTVRPIETQVFSTSIDVGINTARERFTQPANRSLIYDVHSDTWHGEP